MADSAGTPPPPPPARRAYCLRGVPLDLCVHDRLLLASFMESDAFSFSVCRRTSSQLH
jgi:hypothetical protein